jgi:hypothetical protein
VHQKGTSEKKQKNAQNLVPREIWGLKMFNIFNSLEGDFGPPEHGIRTPDYTGKLAALCLTNLYAKENT